MTTQFAKDQIENITALKGLEMWPALTIDEVADLMDQPENMTAAKFWREVREVRAAVNQFIAHAAIEKAKGWNRGTNPD